MLVAANGFFVAAEFALVRARGRAEIDQMEDEGAGGAALAARQLDHIDEYLSACQLGITMASLGIGFLGEPADRQPDREAARASRCRTGCRWPSSLVFAYLITTALHITVGEQVPKIYAITHAEAIARRAARLLEAFRVRLQAADLGAEHGLQRDAAGHRRGPQGRVRGGRPRPTT